MAKGYKLVREKGQKLYPLYVLADEELPIRKWLHAKPGHRTPNGKVKSKLGELAFRPGWHINDLPYVEHIYSIRELPRPSFTVAHLEVMASRFIHRCA